MKAALTLLRRLFGRRATHRLPPLPRPHLLCLHIVEATEQAIRPFNR